MRESHRQTGERLTDRLRDRQTDRQVERETQTDRNLLALCNMYALKKKTTKKNQTNKQTKPHKLHA